MVRSCGCVAPAGVRAKRPIRSPPPQFQPRARLERSCASAEAEAEARRRPRRSVRAPCPASDADVHLEERAGQRYAGSNPFARREPRPAATANEGGARLQRTSCRCSGRTATPARGPVPERVQMSEDSYLLRRSGAHPENTVIPRLPPHSRKHETISDAESDDRLVGKAVAAS